MRRSSAYCWVCGCDEIGVFAEEGEDEAGEEVEVDSLFVHTIACLTRPESDLDTGSLKTMNEQGMSQSDCRILIDTTSFQPRNLILFSFLQHARRQTVRRRWSYH